MHRGFQTASGKEVRISEKALNHVKKLFEEDIHSVPSGSSSVIIRKANQVTLDGDYVGPAVKKVKLSEDSGKGSLESEIIDQEVLDSTLALLADEEEDERNQLMSSTMALLADDDERESFEEEERKDDLALLSFPIDELEQEVPGDLESNSPVLGYSALRRANRNRDKDTATDH